MIRKLKFKKKILKKEKVEKNILNIKKRKY